MEWYWFIAIAGALWLLASQWILFSLWMRIHTLEESLKEKGRAWDNFLQASQVVDDIHQAIEKHSPQAKPKLPERPPLRRRAGGGG